MKRLTIIFSCLFISSLSYAANKMSMVTYFPVPYVAYSQVSADQQLDVGLTTTCNMNLGCSQSNTNLKANTVNLNAGKLELNQGKGMSGTSITLGTGTGNGQISFKDVRIQGGNMQSLNADTMNVQTLNLFGKPFPPCRGKGGSDGQMKWQQLKLQGYSGTDADGELYLVCGDIDVNAEPQCSSPKSKWNGERCVCPGGYDYYIPGSNACCSWQTPKTDTRCWKKEENTSGFFSWQKQKEETYTCLIDDTMGMAGSAQCKYECINFKGFNAKKCDPTVKEGQGCVEYAPDGVYRGQSGEACIICSQVESGPLNGVSLAGFQCPRDHQCRTRTVKWHALMCNSNSAQTTVTYKALWDPNVHKNY